MNAPRLFDMPAQMPGQLGMEAEIGQPFTGEWHSGKRCSWCGTVGDCVATSEDNGATFSTLWACARCNDDA